MSLPEQVGKVASGTIDALRASPGLLVLVVLQVMTLGVLAYVNEHQNMRRHERELLLLRSCTNVHDEGRR